MWGVSNACNTVWTWTTYIDTWDLQSNHILYTFLPVDIPLAYKKKIYLNWFLFGNNIPQLNLRKGKIYIPWSLLKGNDNTNLLRVFPIITKILRAKTIFSNRPKVIIRKNHTYSKFLGSGRFSKSKNVLHHLFLCGRSSSSQDRHWHLLHPLPLPRPCQLQLAIQQLQPGGLGLAKGNKGRPGAKENCTWWKKPCHIVDW